MMIAKRIRSNSVVTLDGAITMQEKTASLHLDKKQQRQHQGR